MSDERRARERSSEDGATLLEVLCATAILAGVLAAVLTAFVVAARALESSRALTVATAAADDTLEELRTFAFDQVHELLTGSTPLAPALASWRSDEEDGVARHVDHASVLNRWRERVESELPDGVLVLSVRGQRAPGVRAETFRDARVLQVLVTVRWREGRRERSVHLQALRG